MSNECLSLRSDVAFTSMQLPAVPQDYNTLIHRHWA